MTNTQIETQWKHQAEKVIFETRPFIGGDYVQSTSDDVFHTENPADQSELAVFPDGGVVDIDRAVSTARDAFGHGWRGLAPDGRKSILMEFAARIRSAREELALLDSLEMGMPISMALMQADIAANFVQFYAELADKICGEVAPTDSGNTLAMTYQEPRGVVGVISPWNYPLLAGMLAYAPALAAGNTIVAKPSEQAPSSVLKLAEIAMQSGLPPGVFNVVPGRGTSTGAALAKHMDVDKIHFTGSTAVGRKLLEYSGQSNGKPVMLELGGKSPQIVFEDAVNLKGLGASLAQSSFINTGQLCVARTRLVVHESIKDQVLDEIRAGTKSIFTIGDPLEEAVNFGPIASAKQFERVSGYLELGKQEGAELQTIGTLGAVPESGYYLQPIVFEHARNDMRIAQEEIFGPVMTVMTFKTDEEAVNLANDVSYGLAATVWTRDLGRARRLARDLDAGRVDIRATAADGGASLATLSAEPFGASGHGVMGGRRGLDPYMRLKGIQIITD